MMNPLTRFSLFSLAAGLLMSAGCELQEFLPTTADQAGQPSAQVAVAIQVDPKASLDADLEALEVEVVDVLIHQVEADAWAILNNESVTMDLVHPSDQGIKFTAIPVPMGTYDKIRVVLGDAEIASQGSRHSADIADTEVDLPLVLDLEEDTVLTLAFDRSDPLEGADWKDWTFKPKFRVSWQHPGSKDRDDPAQD
jgi:hypothetical protein